ncbi:MAG: hypothetical protein MUP13_04735, partial [Thermoanaerobaculales bacterium]|nr:hypothetical protein [Thermoanaerobaculales bacterium]
SRYVHGMATFTFQFRRSDVNPSGDSAWAEFFVHAADEEAACEEAKRLKPNEPTLRTRATISESVLRFLAMRRNDSDLTDFSASGGSLVSVA